jgi:hypothetical protein
MVQPAKDRVGDDGSDVLNSPQKRRAESGADAMIGKATEKLLAEIEEEGWMTRPTIPHLDS